MFSQTSLTQFSSSPSILGARTLFQISHTDIYKDLMEVYNDRALPYSTIVDWARRFSEGREWMEDSPRAGRPI